MRKNNLVKIGFFRPIMGRFFVLFFSCGLEMNFDVHYMVFKQKYTVLARSEKKWQKC